MKCFIFAIILLDCHIPVFSQIEKINIKSSKPPLELSVLGKFSSISSASLSNDGNYAIYSIYNPSTSTNSFFVQDLKSNWKWEIGSVPCQFAYGGRYVIYKSGKDSLTLLQLENKGIEYIPNVTLYKVSNDGKWIGYIDSQRKMTLKDLETKRERLFDSANDFFFIPSDSTLFIELSKSNGHQDLLMANIYDDKMRSIWSAQENEKSGNYIFSENGNKLAFVVESKAEKTLWVYRQGNESAIEISKQELKKFAPDLIFKGINYRGFTEDGNKLFIELKETTSVDPNLQGVDVWSYSDERLQSEQLKKMKPKTYIGVISITSNQLIRLEQQDDKLISSSNDFALIANIKGDITYDEWYWNKAIKSSVYLVSINTGTRKLIKDSLPGVIASSYWLSPEGKYIIYYDGLKKSYFSYETSSGIVRNITNGISTEWIRYDKKDIKMGKYMPIYCASAGWLKNDKAVILYSQCDIFQVDPAGKNPPINLTNGYGKANNIEFRCAIENNQIFNEDELLYLSAFNRVNKTDGFFKVKLGKCKNPDMLTVEPAIYKGTWEDERFPPVYPIKAKNNDIYLVRRMTAKESPNYFWTKDFKEFNRITEIYPERGFNWLTTELVNWKTADGKACQGILYKPQNFDPTKKYPVIFHYYERVTEALNVFLAPDVSHGELNIPYFVSNGYLVFTPDFHYEVGHPGKSVLNTVISAVQYLSKLPYVDNKHIGLQGHSRGGWETNFIITHTNLFSAAISASGMCDYVGLYNGIRSFRQGVSRQMAFETLYQRMGTTLWDNPELFIENSPIFRANRVETPLLMMANKNDDDVPFEQGVEFFTALRRLGKKVWMLQYDNGAHVVFDKDAQDFTFRMKQFFDHYLMNSPIPKWMAEGIPAKLKASENEFTIVPKD